MSTTPTGEARIEGTVLDHVAHAVPRWQDVWHRYATDLGAVWSSGGPGPGFAPAQLEFANHARVEVLMPWDVEANEFLARFLVANGPGPHHVTFKVPDLTDAIEQVRAYGIEPIGVDFTDPQWMECFLHPKLATGVVVQLAEQHGPWGNPAPDDFPTAHRMLADGTGPVPPASLLRVCHVVADLDAALDLFAGLLEGRATDEGAAPGVRWVDLAWSGPLGVRLVGPDGTDPSGPVATWLGGLPGRVHHVTVAVAEPGDVPGAAPTTSAFAALEVDGGDAMTWEIPRSVNAGLSVVLVPADPGSGTPPWGR